MLVAQQPVFAQQSVFAQQPILVPGQPVMMSAAPGVTQPIPGLPTAIPAGMPPTGFTVLPASMGMNGAAFVPGNAQLPPDITGIGKTGIEVAMEQNDFAQTNELFAPQDFKPSDDNPSRYYYVREVDGSWTQRNRFTIDNLGDCVWYTTPEGYFYAVRKPN